MTPNVYRACLLFCLIALTGCAGEQTADYSPGYSYATANGYRGSAKGAGGAVLVPDACRAPAADVDHPPFGTMEATMPELGPHLPPGCANAYNLQRMAERPSDLVEGRRMGRFAGAPTARAARRYLQGEKDNGEPSGTSLGGAGGRQTQPSVE